ncbi:MAG: hypothetical protein GEU81_11860 [Nitriliruptorales bacterium]|nr:hypothetical protein [Nitriliruptorales bacterium]
MTDIREEAKEEDYGPVLSGGQGRERRRGRRGVRYVATFMGAALLFGAGLFGTLLWVGGGVERIEIAGLTGTSDTQPEQSSSGESVLQEVTGVTNVLLVGSDSRTGLSEEQLLRLGTHDDGDADLTDTLMLVQLDAENHRAQALSFPRDLLVTHCDGSRGRINAAFRLGEERESFTGPGCLVETVARLSGIDIDHYVHVNFEGFIQAVDAIGGVTFHIDEPLRDRPAGLDLQPGCVTFDGAKALGFVRARHLDSDYGRIARQQRFMRELLAEATSIETLTNPAKVMRLVRAVGGSLTTDDQLSTLQMAQLAYTFRELTNDGLETYTVPGYDEEWNGASVQVMDEDEARELFARFRETNGALIAADATPGLNHGEGDGDGFADGEATSPPDDSAVAPSTEAATDWGGADSAESEIDPGPEATFAGAEVSGVAC